MLRCLDKRFKITNVKRLFRILSLIVKNQENDQDIALKVDFRAMKMN